MQCYGNLLNVVSDPWDGVFEEVQLNVVPLQFLKSILIEFVNSKSWEIKISADIRLKGWSHINSLLADVSKHYSKSLQQIDFLIDQKKVKRTIERDIRNFVKKRLL